MNKQIAYVIESNGTTEFFNSNGQLITNLGGKCLSYTSNSATMLWGNRRDVFKFDLQGRTTIIRSDNV